MTSTVDIGNIRVEDKGRECLHFDSFESFTPPEPSWCHVADQCLYKSTWHGLGSALNHFIQMVADVFFSALFAVISLTGLLLCGREWGFNAGKMCIGQVYFVGTHMMGFIYQLIRAVPIVGYPLSQWINHVTDFSLRIEAQDDDVVTSSEEWHDLYVRMDSTRQKKNPLFGHFDPFTEPTENVCEVIGESLWSSTWNGVGSTLYNIQELTKNTLSAIACLIVAISFSCFCCYQTKREAAYAFGASCLINTVAVFVNLKNIVYHTIRAIPIVGYFISQRMNLVAAYAYSCESVEEHMQAFHVWLKDLTKTADQGISVACAR